MQVAYKDILRNAVSEFDLSGEEYLQFRQYIFDYATDAEQTYVALRKLCVESDFRLDENGKEAFLKMNDAFVILFAARKMKSFIASHPSSFSVNEFSLGVRINFDQNAYDEITKPIKDDPGLPDLKELLVCPWNNDYWSFVYRLEKLVVFVAKQHGMLQDHIFAKFMDQFSVYLEFGFGADISPLRPPSHDFGTIKIREVLVNFEALDKTQQADLLNPVKKRARFYLISCQEFKEKKDPVKIADVYVNKLEMLYCKAAISGNLGEMKDAISETFQSERFFGMDEDAFKASCSYGMAVRMNYDPKDFVDEIEKRFLSKITSQVGKQEFTYAISKAVNDAAETYNLPLPETYRQRAL